ncbi:MAG TPA: 2-dehydropantoate 2-reductase [Solirubrobacteraceae bacterium]|nr:2-dehydropantoate 2-reductase [Solirubrobacteraceae bacterium]
MELTICGGGSLGLAYAGLMADWVSPKLFVRSPSQAADIMAQGVTVSITDGSVLHAPVKASADPSILADTEIAICLVKYPDTASLGAQLSDHLSPSATVVSLQTGVRPLADYRTLLGRDRVLGGVSYLGARRTGPASVSIGTNLRTVLGLDGATEQHAARVQALVDALADTSLEFEVSQDIAQVIWDKMIIACSQNSVSGLTGATFRQLREDVTWHPILAKLVAEIEAAGTATGANFAPDQLQRVFANWESLPDHRASTYVDLEGGRLTEVDALNGTIAELGREYGLDAPINEMLTAMVHLAERAAPKS